MDSATAVLLVEDNEDDVFLFRRAFKQAGLAIPLQVVENGQLAIDYLSGAGPFADRAAYPFPTAIFLDMKMPYKNGLEVLAWARGQRFPKRPEVVMLTSSAEQRDVTEAHRLGAAAYLLKPAKMETLLDLIKIPSRYDDRHKDDLFRKLP
jgi:CheY-like chemotaxis protein